MIVHATSVFFSFVLYLDIFGVIPTTIQYIGISLSFGDILCASAPHVGLTISDNPSGPCPEIPMSLNSSPIHVDASAPEEVDFNHEKHQAL